MSEEKGMNLSAKQLQDLITATVSAAVAESKKPAPLTEEQLAEIRNANEMRLQQRDLVLQAEQNKRAIQRACSHMRRDNTCSGVYVQDGNYIICQQCQGIVRPEVDEKFRDATSQYDTLLFNRLFQLAATPATF